MNKKEIFRCVLISVMIIVFIIMPIYYTFELTEGEYIASFHSMHIHDDFIILNVIDENNPDNIQTLPIIHINIDPKILRKCKYIYEVSYQDGREYISYVWIEYKNTNLYEGSFSIEDMMELVSKVID